MKIRDATPDDAELLASIGARTFRQTYAGMHSTEELEGYIASKFTAAGLRAELENPDTIFLVLESGGEASGYAKISPHNVPEDWSQPDLAEISRIYLDQAQQGRGWGKMLMQSCIDIAKKLGKGGVWLQVWEKNEKAIAFYRAFGFRQHGGFVTFQLVNEVDRDSVWVLEF